MEPLTDAPADASARQQVTALFEAHALGLVRLAKVMLGDQSIAEDVVQDAFVGVYRKWASPKDRDKALGYLRTSVLNGCRTAHRSRTRRDRALLLAPGADGGVSAEESALVGEANREVLAALRALPARQREGRRGDRRVGPRDPPAGPARKQRGIIRAMFAPVRQSPPWPCPPSTSLPG